MTDTTWTKEESNYLLAQIQRMGGMINPGYLSYHLKKALGVSKPHPVIIAEANRLKGSLKAVTPVTPYAPLKTPSRRYKTREKCRDIINEIIEEFSSSPREPLPVIHTDKGCTPVLLLSDLHFGELVKVNGEYIFNFEIAKRDLTTIVNKAISAPELTAYNVDEIIVLLGGDIIDGEMIYPTQATHVEGGAYAQYKSTIQVIWEVLTKLQSRFGFVQVYCAAGNHGRSSRLHAEMSNWDNVIYYSLALLCEGQDVNISVEVPEQMWTDFLIRDKWNAHLRHIGVTQPASASPGRRLRNWIEMHSADILFWGHYHDPAMFSSGYARAFKNGGLPPGNDYSEKLGFLESRGQWLVGVTDDELVAFSKILTP
jgi:hypothetical protein